MNIRKWIWMYNIGMLFLLVGLPFTTVQAACPLPAFAHTSLGTNICTISAVSGVEVVSGSNNTGVLTLDNAGGSITINAGGELHVGSIAITAGSISIQGGVIRTNAPLYVTDADSDGYPADLTLANATGTGKRRLGEMTTLTVDANDNQACASGADPAGLCNTCVDGGVAYVSNGFDDKGDCTATGCNSGNCNGAGACAPIAAGEQGQATCTRCDGSSLTAVNITSDTQDTEGTNLCNATCKKCSSGSCINQASGEDLFSNQCAPYGCTSYIGGWSATSSWQCKKAIAGANDGMCNGLGACYTTFADSCTIGTTDSYACGTATGCEMACTVGSLATYFDQASEVCYTSSQHGCSTGQACNTSGACVAVGVCRANPNWYFGTNCNTRCASYGGCISSWQSTGCTGNQYVCSTPFTAYCKCNN